MRSVVFVFLMVWESGIAGMQFVGWWGFIVVLACSTLLAHKVWPRIEYTIAVLSVLLLATIYGQPELTSQVPCSLESGSSVGVAEVSRIRDTSTQYVVTADNCRVLLTGPRFPQYNVGDTLIISGGTQQSVTDLPDELDGYAAYLERRGIDATWRYADITLKDAGPDIRGEWRELLIRRVQILFPEPDASIISAMLFARRGTIPESVTEAFRTTGTSHILAISGLHVSLIALFLVVIVSVAPLPRWVRVAIVGIVLWTYIGGVGAPLSSVRAGIFWTLVVVGYQMRWLISLPTVVTLAVAGLLTFNPRVVHEVGLQLSVSAVVGIFLVMFVTKPVLARTTKLWRGVLSIVIVSLGATLGTVPLVAYHFGTLTLIGVMANVLVVPLVPLVIVGSLLTLGTSVIAWSVARLAAWFVHLVLFWQLWVVDVLSAIPGVAFADLTFSARWIPLYYALLIGVISAIIRLQRRRWREMWS